MFRLCVKRSFSAAHFLRGYQGQCEELHGHTWYVEAELEAENLDEIGLSLDFKEVNARLDLVLRELDHRLLNDHPYFKERNPSAEELARFVYGRLAANLPDGVAVAMVRVWESENAWAGYTE